jgi:hypothetical protein
MLQFLLSSFEVIRRQNVEAILLDLLLVSRWLRYSLIFWFYKFHMNWMMIHRYMWICDELKTSSNFPFMLGCRRWFRTESIGARRSGVKRFDSFFFVLFWMVLNVKSDVDLVFHDDFRISLMLPIAQSNLILWSKCYYYGL